MLELVVPAREWYSEEIGEFINTKETKLFLEHSLLSVSKWEAKWKKPYMDEAEQTPEETIDYIRCMTINKGVDPFIYYGLTDDMYKTIKDYIADPMTATTITNHNKSTRRISRGKTTSEMIYYWMVSYGIPFECQKWHLSRLMTLINVCIAKGSPDRKMPKNEIYKQNTALNKARRAQRHSKG